MRPKLNPRAVSKLLREFEEELEDEFNKRHPDDDDFSEYMPPVKIRRMDQGTDEGLVQLHNVSIRQELERSLDDEEQADLARHHQLMKQYYEEDVYSAESTQPLYQRPTEAISQSSGHNDLLFTPQLPSWVTQSTNPYDLASARTPTPSFGMGVRNITPTQVVSSPSTQYSHSVIDLDDVSSSFGQEYRNRLSVSQTLSPLVRSQTMSGSFAPVFYRMLRNEPRRDDDVDL